jgi:transposase
MRIIGLDIHRAFAEATGAHRHAPPSSRGFREESSQGGCGRRRSHRQRGLGRGGDRASRQEVVIANPKQVRVIAHAKIKTDTIDAGVLAQLYASGFLPEVWVPD